MRVNMAFWVLVVIFLTCFTAIFIAVWLDTVEEMKKRSDMENQS